MNESAHTRAEEPGRPPRWVSVLIEAVIVSDDRAQLDHAHVAEIQKSIARLGGRLILQPIIIDSAFVLIDGAHRLEAARIAGWSQIAACVVDEIGVSDKPMLETESLRVRKQLGVLALEEVWRRHYEPELRAVAKERQLDALRSGEVVIGNSNNDAGGGHAGNDGRSLGEPTSHETVAQAAKRLTGCSLDTLNKVTWIRERAEGPSVTTELQEAARRCLQQLAKPGMSVETVYRALHELQCAQDTQLDQDIECARDPISASSEGIDELEALRSRSQRPNWNTTHEHTLERALTECSRIAERLEKDWNHQLTTAGRQGVAEAEIVRAIRVSLASALASMIAIECKLQSDPMSTFQKIGLEVSRYLSRYSLRMLQDHQDGSDSGSDFGRGQGANVSPKRSSDSDFAFIRNDGLSRAREYRNDLERVRVRNQERAA